MEESKNCILLVDDEAHVVSALRRALMEEDYDIVSAHGGKEALEILSSQPIKVIVCDERMPGMHGAELLSMVSRRHPQTVRILLTGQATLESAMKAVNEGEIWRFFAKPWNDLDLALAIRAAIEKYDLEMNLRKMMALVRTQNLEIKHLKETTSGNTPAGKSEDGSYFMPELTDHEIAQILKECGPG
jgi:DNA-binding NtrC family response regulator